MTGNEAYMIGKLDCRGKVIRSSTEFYLTLEDTAKRYCELAVPVLHGPEPKRPLGTPRKEWAKFLKDRKGPDKRVKVWILMLNQRSDQGPNMVACSSKWLRENLLNGKEGRNG